VTCERETHTDRQTDRDGMRHDDVVYSPCTELHVMTSSSSSSWGSGSDGGVVERVADRDIVS